MATQPRITPIPSNAPPFAHEFTKRMRARKDISKKPSVRQTQSIPQLLSARYFKNGKLTLEDFLDAAVFTTYPPDQRIAREVAEDILLGREKVERPKLSDRERDRLAKAASKQKTDALKAVMDQIRKEQEMAKYIQPDKVQAGYDYLQDLQQNGDKMLYQAATDYLTDGDIVLRGITSNEELKEIAGNQLLDKAGVLTSKDLGNSPILDVLDDFCETSNAAEQLAAKSLRGDDDVKDEFSKLSQRDSSTAARALRHIEEMDSLDKKTREELDNILQNELNNLNEAADYVAEMKRLPDNIDQHIQDAPNQYSLADAAAFAEKIQKHTNQDIMDDLLEAYNEQYNNGGHSNVDMRQLADTARDNESWDSLLEKETESTIQDANARSSPSDFLKSAVAQGADLADQLPTEYTKKEWKVSMQKLADAAVETSPTKTHLRNTVKQLSRMGQVPSRKTIRSAGERLGMTEEEILELLNPSYEVIKKLIESGVKDFDRLHNLISAAGLSHQQMQQLADIAAQQENQSALGAIAHEDLHAALGTNGGHPGGYTRQRYGQGIRAGAGAQEQPYDKDRAKMAMGGLLGGPATNIVRLWYAYRDQLPDELKKQLREIAKRLLIDLGMRYARQTMGSSMLGGIQESTTVRPFKIGDDMDLINLEETIDSLLSQGRTNFKVIETSDFLVTETYQGHRAFYWALDKSGSMDSSEKLGMLAISVMAGLYGVKKDDFGVVLFDHDTHIVKRMDQKSVSVEKVASDLLEARAGGGTGGETSIRLALENFEDTRAKEKIFVFSTDMYLSDQPQCEALAERMKPLGIKMIILVPKSSYNPQAADSLAKKAHGIVLDIASIDELPEKLLRVTNY
ncbi:MAG: VWA domain-containing protein [Candidatus Thorarchaeota archaeon]